MRVGAVGVHGNDRAIRRVCRPFYAKIGRPSIPPEQLFLALVGGYLLGIPGDRKLVMELQCNMALQENQR